MLLSILIPGKNDNFRKSNRKSLKLNLEQTIFNLKKINVNDVEVILCDWGSEIPIIYDIIESKHDNFKCVYVPPNIAKKYNRNSNYSIVHPINTAFRRSSGKYVIFWDSDCFVPYDDFEMLYSFVKNIDIKNNMNFYWGSRHNIEFKNYEEVKTSEELIKNLKENNISSHEPLNSEKFMGTSISILMNRNLWEDSTGWYEELIYWGWQDIEFHRRLENKYKYGGDLFDYNIKFYHLKEDKIQSNLSHRLENPWLNAKNFKANEESWGLNDEKLEIIT